MSGKEFHLIKELTYSRLTAICAFEPPFFAYLLCGSLLNALVNVNPDHPFPHPGTCGALEDLYHHIGSSLSPQYVGNSHVLSLLS